MGAVWGDHEGSCVVGSCVSPPLKISLVAPGGPHPLLLGGGVTSGGRNIFKVTF